MRNSVVTIALSTLLVFLSCSQKGEQEIYLLPKGFTGHVLVILDQKDGIPKKYEGNARVYEIPATGILKTQFSTNEGWTGLPEFYYDRIAKQNKIPVRMDFKNISLYEVNATLLSTGLAYKNIDGTDGIRFKECYLGTRAQIEEASKKAEKLDILELMKEN